MLILELICKACSSDNCRYHESQTTVRDKITGLEVEVRCTCVNCMKS